MIKYNKPNNFDLNNASELHSRRYLFYDIFLDYKGRIIFLSHQYPDFDIDFDEIEIFYGDTKLPINFVRVLHPEREYSDDSFGMVIGKTDTIDEDIDFVSIKVRYQNLDKNFDLQKYNSNDEIVIETSFDRKVLHLVEWWIEYHLKIEGIDKIHIYFTDSVEENPRVLDILGKYIESNKVELTEWYKGWGIVLDKTNINKNCDMYWWDNNSRLGQDQTMTHVLWKLNNRAKWIGYVDLDEFLILPSDTQNIKEYLNKIPSKYDSILVKGVTGVLDGFGMDTEENYMRLRNNNGYRDLITNKTFIDANENFNILHRFVKPNEKIPFMNAHKAIDPVGKGTSFLGDGYILYNGHPEYHKNMPNFDNKIQKDKMFFIHMILFTHTLGITKENVPSRAPSELPSKLKKFTLRKNR
jgi:hypothetical protein